MWNSDTGFDNLDIIFQLNDDFKDLPDMFDILDLRYFYFINNITGKSAKVCIKGEDRKHFIQSANSFIAVDSYIIQSENASKANLLHSNYKAFSDELNLDLIKKYIFQTTDCLAAVRKLQRVTRIPAGKYNFIKFSVLLLGDSKDCCLLNCSLAGNKVRPADRSLSSYIENPVISSLSGFQLSFTDMFQSEINLSFLSWADVYLSLYFPIH